MSILQRRLTTLFICLICLIFSGFDFPINQTKSISDIELTISELRNGNGFIHISLFNSADGFPSDPTKAYRTLSIAAKQSEMLVLLSGVAPGNYAIAIIHDENNNNGIDTNFAGIPLEGYGSSGSNRKYGPPSFKKSEFLVKAGKTRLTIRMNYLF